MTSKPSARLISVAQCIGKGYGNGWFTNCRARYRCFKGARNTKKSVDIMGYEPIFKILTDEWRNVLFLRENATDHATSTYPNIKKLIYQMGLEKEFRFTANPLKITYRPTGQVMLFKGMSDPTCHTSIKAEHGIMSDVYVEEASQLRSYEDFRQVDGSLRVGLKEMERWGMGEDCIQITFCFNPWRQDHWLYDVFFKGRMEDDPAWLDSHDFQDSYWPDFTLGFGFGLYLHSGCYRMNEFRNPSYDRAMEALRAASPDIYKVEAYGMWGNATDACYPEWGDRLRLEPAKAFGMRFARYAIGVDNGLSDGEGHVKNGSDARFNSATTMQLCGLTADYSTLVALDEFFWSNQQGKKTEPELMAEIVKTIKAWQDKYWRHPDLLRGGVVVYVDSASRGYREGLELEAKRQGLTGVAFMASTKLPIIDRVMFCRRLMGFGEFLVSDDCPNLQREIRNSRVGEKKRAREDFDDHAINANEYAWAPLLPWLRRWKEYKPQ